MSSSATTKTNINSTTTTSTSSSSSSSASTTTNRPSTRILLSTNNGEDGGGEKNTTTTSNNNKDNGGNNGGKDTNDQDNNNENSSTTTTTTTPSCNLIINYLPQTMTDENFRVLFAKYGDIRSAKIIRNKNTGYSYGFGFVEYFNKTDAKQAIDNLNGKLINNKTIKVSFARPSSNQIKKANLYITNLPTSFTEKDLKNLFSECGNIIQCRLIGNNSGTAFVLFNLHEEAKQAIINFDETIIPGTNCKIKVKFATNETNKKLSSMNNNKDNLNSNLLYSSSYTNNNSNNVNLIPKNNFNSSPSQRRNRELIQPIIMMDNNHSYDNNKINNKSHHHHHHSNHHNLNSSGPMRNASHHHNRYNPLSQAQQYSTGNSSIGGNNSMDDPYGLSMYHSNNGRGSSSHYYQQYGSGGSSYFNSSYGGGNSLTSTGLSSESSMLSGLDANGSGGGGNGECILFVYNIGPETDELNLGKLFSFYGQVLRVNVIRKGSQQDPSSTSSNSRQQQQQIGRGYGFVTMSSYEEALNAIQHLNGFKFINDRPLQVSFKRI